MLSDPGFRELVSLPLSSAVLQGLARAGYTCVSEVADLEPGQLASSKLILQLINYSRLVLCFNLFSVHRCSILFLAKVFDSAFDTDFFTRQACTLATEVV